MTDGLGLGGAYGGMIERIQAQGGDRSRLGMGALMWVSHAERPLRADELCHALAVELGSRDFDEGNIPSITTLVGCCQGLITVDKEGSTVRLVHFTLREYLSVHHYIFSRPHSAMAEICLTYLNSQEVKALSTYYSDGPLFNYCSRYWRLHAKREPSDDMIALALELLREFDGHVSAELLLQQVENAYLGRPGTRISFSGMHCASLFGINEVVVALIGAECCGINEGDFRGYTPLAWAACKGHDGLVKMLLELKDVDPDKPDCSGKTPLSHASHNGHERVVKILLGREEVSPDKPDHRHRTPLSYAAENGHEGVVKILLGLEVVNPDKLGDRGRTPLSYAAQSGHARVVRILLRRQEVDPDRPCTMYSRTPLSWASHNGHEEVMKILLERGDVNPDGPNCYGQTPLAYSAMCGHEGVVRILLGRDDVNPDGLSGAGQTPLSYAAENGHTGV